jgi:hypothetical protein
MNASERILPRDFLAGAMMAVFYPVVVTSPGMTQS